MIDDIIAVVLIAVVVSGAIMALNSFANENGAMISELNSYYAALNKDKIELQKEENGRSSILIYYFLLENSGGPIIIDGKEYKKEDFEFDLKFNWKIIGLGKTIEVGPK